MTKKILVLGLVFIISLSVFAHDQLPVMPSFELYAVGKIDQCPVYQLKLNSLRSTPYQVLIKDEFGDLLYEEYLSGNDIVRNYMINILELGNRPVSIEVINASGKIIKTFTTTSGDIISK
jgi:hypothetical protein